MDTIAALIESAAAVVGEVELDTVLRRLVKEARIATGAEYAALGVLGSHGVLSDFIHEGITEEAASRIGELPKGRGLLGTVIRDNKTLLVESIADHPDAFGFPEHHPTMTSFLGVPVSAGSHAFGNLYLTDKPGGFSDADVVTAEALSRIAGAAVQTARLQQRLRRVAVIEDRERIARDLHDTVIQDLFAVGLGLQSLAERVSDESATSVLDGAVDRLDEAVEALRKYIFRLRASAGSNGSLDSVLQEVVSRMGSAYPSEVTLQADLDGSLQRGVEEEIVMIVTEALSNALRHANARTVEVEVESISGGWRLRVEDDGSGFGPDRQESGMGLHNMRVRASAIGAELTVESNPGHGTIVRAEGPRLS